MDNLFDLPPPCIKTFGTYAVLASARYETPVWIGDIQGVLVLYPPTEYRSEK